MLVTFMRPMRNNNLGGLVQITEKTIRENAFEQKKKKAGFNLILGSALIGLRTTGPWRLGLRAPLVARNNE